MTGSSILICFVSRDKRARYSERSPGSQSSRLSSVQMTGRVLPCPDENNGSLAIWFRISSQHTRRGNPKRKSAKIELCVIRLISLIESFCRSHDRRNRLKIGRTCAGLRAGADYEWSDFVSTVAVSDANFSVPTRTKRPGSTTPATTTHEGFPNRF